MTPIEMNGLCGSSPIGAMAAFGLLRVCSQIGELGAVALGWKQTSDWHPVLAVSKGASSATDLARLLTNHLRSRYQAPFLTWQDDIKVEPEILRTRLSEVRHSANRQSNEVASFFAAFGSEFITARSTPDVKPTAFHMSAGQQKFLKSARELAESISPARRPSRGQTAAAVQAETESAFAEALAGPWRYQDTQHALGWDPATEALGALSSIAPSKAGPASVRAAVWLAFEALPLFPCVPSGRKLETRCFAMIDREFESFTWPLWNSAISLTTLQSLLALDALNQNEPLPRDLTSRGIKAVYRSKCFRDGNGRGTLRHAVRCSMANGQLRAAARK